MTGKESARGDQCTYLFGVTSWNCYWLPVVRWTGWVTDVPSDVVLLEILDCYLLQAEDGDDCSLKVEAWRTLIHVRQKWRSVAFGSPHCLNFRLLCPVRHHLRRGCYLTTFSHRYLGVLATECTWMDNVICGTTTGISGITGVSTAAQEPFPALTDLAIWLIDYDSAPSHSHSRFIFGRICTTSATATSRLVRWLSISGIFP